MIGCAVTVLTAGFRHKNLVYTAALMLVLVGVVVLSMMGGTVDMSGFIQAATEAIANAYPPAVLFMGALCDGSPVSYTHLDVYKRQVYGCSTYKVDICCDKGDGTTPF